MYARTRQEVVAKLATLLRTVGERRPVPDERLSVAAYLTSWLEAVGPSLRPQSIRRYHQLITDHAVPALGRRRLTRLTPEDLQAFYAVKLGEGLSPATVRMLHFILHRALKDAERWGRCSRNVADLVDPPRLPRKEAAVLSVSQTCTLLDAARGDRLEALVALALKSGMRRGELLGLRWVDVDLEEGVVRVTRTLQPSMHGSGHTLAEPKSASSRRPVVLDQDLVELLRRHRVAQSAERLRVGAGWDERGFVFTTELGRTIAPATLLRVWARLLAAAGIERVPFHTARHTAATLMLAAGVSPRVARERLGHATVSITLDRYSHVTDAAHREAARGVQRLLSDSR